GGSDIAMGLRVAAALARQDTSGASRIVLLSDGRPTSGDLDAALTEIADVPVDVVPLGTLPREPRLAIDRLELPAYVRANESFDGTVIVDSSHATSARLEIDFDSQQTSEETIQLTPGENRIGLSQTLSVEGFHRIGARLAGASGADARGANTETFVIVKAPPRVLIIEERRGEGAPVQA